jgi:hypothetical protein
MLSARAEQQITDRAWSGYQHTFAGNATRAERSADDLDSPLMRLAAGGSSDSLPRITNGKQRQARETSAPSPRRHEQALPDCGAQRFRRLR